MAEAVLDWPAIFLEIRTELEGVLNSAGELAFQQVFIGEPLAAPLGGPYAMCWYLGRTNSGKTGGAPATLGNVMYAARLQVICLWPLQPERSTLPDWEADIATVDTNIRRAFRGNSTINSEVTDLDITDSEVSYSDLPAKPVPLTASDFVGYRTLRFELRLDNLEGEPISA